MRKFNLKDAAVKRMKNPEPERETGVTKPEEADRITGFRTVSRTDVGRVRKTNQDVLILGGGLAGVADGMGGHNGGEIASGALRDGLLRELSGACPEAETMAQAVKKINLEIWERQERDASLTGMGTTLTLLWPGEKEMLIAQVGDSRAYLLRGGEMRQVTSDHSLVADMVRRGVLTEEQAACHPMRNYITRAVGTEDTIDVDVYREGRQAGDRWLVCSDGLYGQMSRDRLFELARGEDEEEAADRLLQTALDNGGKDNISFLLMTDVTGAVEESPSGPEAGTEEGAEG